MTQTVLLSSLVLAVVVEAGLGRNIVLARRRGDGARLRWLVPQAAGLLLTSVDVAVREGGAFSGGVQRATGLLFWVGVALVAYGFARRGRSG